MTKVYQGSRDTLCERAPVSMARVLAAKGDLLTIRKTDDASVRSKTQCTINKILIGKVSGCGYSLVRSGCVAGLLIGRIRGVVRAWLLGSGASVATP